MIFDRPTSVELVEVVSEFLEIAKMKNIKTTVLEIKENNYAAKALYTSLNFKEINIWIRC